jgi:hypothetical protein
MEQRQDQRFGQGSDASVEPGVEEDNAREDGQRRPRESGGKGIDATLEMKDEEETPAFLRPGIGSHGGSPD